MKLSERYLLKIIEIKSYFISAFKFLLSVKIIAHFQFKQVTQIKLVVLDKSMKNSIQIMSVTSLKQPT